MSTKHTNDGSKPFNVDEWLKIKPKSATAEKNSILKKVTEKNPIPDLVLEHVRVRRSAKQACWVTTDPECTVVTRRFICGIMRDVTFNNTALVMDLYGQRTDADAFCNSLSLMFDANKGHFNVPKSATYKARIYYAASKGGLAIRNSDFVVTSCDFLLLNPDGTSTCCWIKKPAGAPPQEKF